MSFRIVNACSEPVAASVNGDNVGTGSFDAVGVEPNASRKYSIPSDTVDEVVTFGVAVETPSGVGELRTRDIAIPAGIEAGSGTRSDPYVVTADGDLCEH